MRLPYALPRSARRVRFRLRTIMTMIAILAVSVSAKLRHDKCMKRAEGYGHLAKLYAMNARRWNSWDAGFLHLMKDRLDSPPISEDEKRSTRDEFRGLAERYGDLQARCERAAWLRTISIPPPPPPISGLNIFIPAWGD